MLDAAGAANENINSGTGAGPAAISRPRMADDPEAVQRICDAAEKEYRREGDANAPTGGKYVTEFRYGGFNANLKDNDDKEDGKIHVNRVFPHVNTVRGELFQHTPDIQVDPVDGQSAADETFAPLVQMGLVKNVDEAKRAFADGMEELLKYGYTCANTQKENEVCLQDAQLRGMGITKESWDPAKGVSRSDAIKRHELSVDPHCRHALRQSRYLVHTCVLPFDVARDFFEPKGVQLGDPNFKLQESPGLDGDRAKESETADDKDCFKFHEVWFKDRERRILIYRDAVKKTTLQKTSWPWQLQADQFGFTDLAFHRQNVVFKDAFSEIEVIHSLNKAYEKLVRFLDDQTNRAMAKQILYKAGLDPDALENIKKNKPMNFTPIRNFNEDLSRAMYVLDLNSPNDPTIEHLVALKHLADEIVGLDEILRGGQPSRGSDPTATEMDIRASQGERRTGLKVNAIDGFLNEQVMHRALIELSLQTPEKIKQLAGASSALAWSVYAQSPERFSTEYTVKIAGGSTGRRSKREELDRLERMRKGGNEENAVLMSRGMPPKFDTSEILMEQARKDGNRNAERFLFPEQPAMAMPGLPAGMPGAVPPPMGSPVGDNPMTGAGLVPQGPPQAGGALPATPMQGGLPIVRGAA